jgi:hypothetical protein
MRLSRTIHISPPATATLSLRAVSPEQSQSNAARVVLREIATIMAGALGLAFLINIALTALHIQ